MDETAQMATVQMRGRSAGKTLECLVAMDTWLKQANVGDRLVVGTDKDVRVFALVEIRPVEGGRT